jgi:hypothetical protein
MRRRREKRKGRDRPENPLPQAVFGHKPLPQNTLEASSLREKTLSI